MLAIITPVAFTTDKLNHDHELYCIVLADMIRLPATLANRSFSIPEMHMAARSIILDVDAGTGRAGAGIFFNPSRPQHEEHAEVLGIFLRNLREIEAAHLDRGKRTPVAVDITPEMLHILGRNQLNFGDSPNFSVTRDRVVMVTMCRRDGTLYQAEGIPLSYLACNQVEAWGICDNLPVPGTSEVQQFQQVSHPIEVHFGCHLN